MKSSIPVISSEIFRVVEIKASAVSFPLIVEGFVQRHAWSGSIENHKLQFRLATLSDAPHLANLINTSFSDDPTTQVFLTLDHEGVHVVDEAAIAERIAQQQAHLQDNSAARPVAILVGTLPRGGGEDTGNQEVVAHCSIRIADSSTSLEKVVWVGLLAVDVRLKGRGLGGQMLAHSEEYARREWGVGRVELDAVNTRTELIAWYGRRGYIATGETKPFPYEHHPGGRLRDGLSFVMLGKNLAEGESF